MLRERGEFHLEREMALADGLKEVAAELRLVDAADWVAFIRTGQFGNVSNLVNSSTELYFKPGTVSFGLSGDVELKWNGEPSITLAMEFRHRKVNVFFRLLLESRQAGVEIDYISFGSDVKDGRENTRRLLEALTDARIAPISVRQAACAAG